VKGAFASARNYAATRFSPSTALRQPGPLELCGRPIAQHGVQSLLVVDLPDEPLPAIARLGQIAVLLPYFKVFIHDSHPPFFPWTRLVTHTDPAAVDFSRSV
jgi:hypothetical protein